MEDVGSFPQLTSFTHCTPLVVGGKTLGAERMRTRLFLAAALLTSPAYAGDEAQSKCAFMVTTMESYANERAQEGPEHAADYEARKARMKAFVANEKRPDILCDKDL